MTEWVVEYYVDFTTDEQEFTYTYKTGRGALAAIEAVQWKHHKAGHMLKDVKAVRTSIKRVLSNA